MTLLLLVLAASCQIPISHSLAVAEQQLRGTVLLPQQDSVDSQEACGVMIAAFGASRGKYVTAAVANAVRIQAMRPGSGWCPSQPSLERIPVTLVTDVARETLIEQFGNGVESASIVSNSTFDKLSVDANGLSKGWWSEGDPIYRWYHCQSLVHAPYDLTLYLDADATICGADRFAKLFLRFSESGADVAFQNSLSPQGWFMGVPMGEPQGHICTDGDAANPHPVDVKTAEDMESWQSTEEPNAGVILFAKHHAIARKVASEWCSVLEESMRSSDKPRPCDQYALRAAFWNHRHEVNTLVLAEGAEGICRYGPKQGNVCDLGCAIAHGWDFPEVKALLNQTADPYPSYTELVNGLHHDRD